MKLGDVILDARKAVVALGSFEALAVSLGLLDNADAGYATAALGAVSSALVYFASNIPKPKTGTPAVHPDNGVHTSGS